MRSEEEIIDLIVNRDESVMSELMDKYQRPLMRLAMNMLDSEEDARECVNDTFYEVWKSVPQNRPKYLFAYSATICRHLICKRIEYDKALKRSSNVIELTSEMEQCIGREDNLPDGDEERLGEFKGCASPEEKYVYTKVLVFRTNQNDSTATRKK